MANILPAHLYHLSADENDFYDDLLESWEGDLIEMMDQAIQHVETELNPSDDAYDDAIHDDEDLDVEEPGTTTSGSHGGSSALTFVSHASTQSSEPNIPQNANYQVSPTPARSPSLSNHQVPTPPRTPDADAYADANGEASGAANVDAYADAVADPRAVAIQSLRNPRTKQVGRRNMFNYGKYKLQEYKKQRLPIQGAHISPATHYRHKMAKELLGDYLVACWDADSTDPLGVVIDKKRWLGMSGSRSQVIMSAMMRHAHFHRFCPQTTTYWVVLWTGYSMLRMPKESDNTIGIPR